MPYCYNLGSHLTLPIHHRQPLATMCGVVCLAKTTIGGGIAHFPLPGFHHSHERISISLTKMVSAIFVCRSLFS